MKMSIAIVMLLAGTNVQAQEADAPAARDFGAYGRDAAEDSMIDFARCVVRGSPRTAADALATRPGTREETARFNAIAKSRKGCLRHGKLRMKGNWMRGALAEQLYLNRFATPPVEPARPDAPAPVVAEGTSAYQAYADCAVARNAPAIDTLMRSKAGSGEERLAYGQAMPALSSCLAGGENTRLKIDRAVLRGYLAEALLDFRKRPPG
ncbi:MULTISPECIES: hypothetical protein [Sphingobium]|nr:MULTISPECIES: hypothetical protein [Sphingobium]WCP12424.1 hypothetical protein sphantq_00823 [Sphingobium sp. AntQ-1]